jgi:glycosidase
MASPNSQASRPGPAWLEKAVFYEIYPQSFADSNGDGIGDLPGIIDRLDYLSWLGVDAIWLNPCFDSTFLDAGYDVRDYYQVARRYGTNQDLVRLFAEARRRGIRVLLDLVPGHTSIENAWFKESCRHARNEYSDWFIWTDSGWTWEVPGLRVISGYAERNGSYITNFFYSQPALNYGFANPDPRYPWQQPVDAPGPTQVRQELKNVMRFWLEKGASGFRVDMAFSLVKNDPDRKATQGVWQEIRAWLDQDFPEAFLVSEWGNPSQSIPGGFHADFTLHFAMPGYTSLLRKPYGHGPGSDPYGFSFFDRRGHGNIREFLDDYQRHYQATCGQGYIAIPTGNHDINPRLSRDRNTDDLELVFLFLMSMPGTPFIYYGDEIGMRTLQGLPSKEGGYHRTGSRTPMQWSEGLNAGFSKAQPAALYLPVDDSPDRPTVAEQQTDEISLLNRVRRLIALRKTHPALCADGDFAPLYAEAGSYPFVYRRSLGSEHLLVAVNPAAYPVDVKLPEGTLSSQPEKLWGIDQPFHHEADGWRLRMPGVSGGIYRLSSEGTA